MRAIFVLTPSESKRLIAKAVARMEEVQRARLEDFIFIAQGSTNACVAEEILGKPIDTDVYLSGLITRGVLCVTYDLEKPPLLLLEKGELKPPPPTMTELLKDFGPGSIFIKGANAVDPEGNVGILMASPEGGTIGYALGILQARGVKLIVPVGLEKLIPSVRRAASHCGQGTLYYSQGKRVGMMPLVNATVVTEIEALRILTGVEAVHLASGGVNGSEGAVVLVADGSKENLDKAIELTESLKGLPPLKPRKGVCEECGPAPPAPPLCMYQGKKEEELPPFLRGR